MELFWSIRNHFANLVFVIITSSNHSIDTSFMKINLLLCAITFSYLIDVYIHFNHFAYTKWVQFIQIVVFSHSLVLINIPFLIYNDLVPSTLVCWFIDDYFSQAVIFFIIPFVYKSFLYYSSYIYHINIWKYSFYHSQSTTKSSNLSNQLGTTNNENNVCSDIV